jgi:hypothetical protein
MQFTDTEIKLQIVINFRVLNPIIVENFFALPLPEELID